MTFDFLCASKENDPIIDPNTKQRAATFKHPWQAGIAPGVFAVLERMGVMGEGGGDKMQMLACYNYRNLQSTTIIQP